MGLVDSVPVPQGVVRGIVALQTDVPPYGITIQYDMDDASDMKIQDVIEDDAFYRNAVVLFSLIDNVETIQCNIIKKSGEEGNSGIKK